MKHRITKKLTFISCSLLLAVARCAVFAELPGPEAASKADRPAVQAAGHQEGDPSASKPVGWRNDGTGIFPDTTPALRWVPKTKWSEAKNIRWQRSFEHGEWSNAQPILVGKRLLAPLEDTSFVCLDADTGEILWRRDLLFVRSATGLAFARDQALWDERKTASPERIKELDALLIPRIVGRGDGCQERFLKGYTFATPVSDGTLVYIKNLTGVLVALDLDGNAVWAQDIGYLPEHGSVASPCLIDGRLIVWHKTDESVKTFVLSAFDAKTGRPLWQTDQRPAGPSSGCPSPIQIRLPGVTAVLAANGDVVRAADGKILAREVHPQGFGTPICHQNVAFFSAGGRFVAVRLALKEDGTVAATTLWDVAPEVGQKGGDNAHSNSPYGGMVYCEGYVHSLSSKGVYVVIEAATGKIAFANTLPRLDRVYGNLSIAGGRVYIFAMNGRGFVLRPGPSAEVLAENPCLGSNTYSPFFAGKRMYIRNSRVSDWMPGAWIRCIEEQNP
jgi:outer membrane protein assembly factor BamB